MSAPFEPVVIVNSSAPEFQRAAYATKMAEILYQAEQLSDTVRLADASPRDRATYFQIAEAAVQMVACPELREAATYCAADAFQQETGATPFDRLPVDRRHHLVVTTAVVINRFLACLRGAWPQDIPKYRAMAQMDRAEKQMRQRIRVQQIRLAASHGEVK